MPAASLLVALLTYTLQLLVLALVLAGLNRSGLLDDALDRRWLAAAVIAGTVAWMVAQIVPHRAAAAAGLRPARADRRGRARASVQSGRRRVHDDPL